MFNVYAFTKDNGKVSFGIQRLKAIQIFQSVKIVTPSKNIKTNEVFLHERDEMSQHEMQEVEKEYQLPDGEIIKYITSEPRLNENGQPIPLGVKYTELDQIPDGAVVITAEQHDAYGWALRSGKKLSLVDGEIKIIDPENLEEVKPKRKSKSK